MLLCILLQLVNTALILLCAQVIVSNSGMHRGVYSELRDQYQNGSVSDIVWFSCNKDK